jgi:hypothetical protein
MSRPAALAALLTIKASLVLAFVLLVTACSVLTPPRGPADGLAYLEGQVQAAVRSCARLVDERTITVEQGVRCDTVTKQAFAAIDIGRGALKGGDAKGADAQLAAARELLTEIERLTGAVK